MKHGLTNKQMDSLIKKLPGEGLIKIKGKGAEGIRKKEVSEAIGYLEGLRKAYFLRDLDPYKREMVLDKIERLLGQLEYMNYDS